MLERIALHQTRLRMPGLALNAQGVALGAKGLVLFASLDRLVGFLSLYSSGASLGELIDSLSIDIVRSKLGNREVILSFTANGADRMDRVAELARLSGGYTFTGTKRHFVQYRNAAAPFGYDVSEISPTDAAISLSHTQFTQTYAYDQKVNLATLLLRLEPRVAPSTLREEGPRWICAESGLGPALIHYFVRSRVAAEVAVAEWPPASEFDEAPIVRHLFKLAELPARMGPLMRQTPGLGVFVPQGPNAAVEIGFEHPVNLRACPVFPRESLVLLRGGGRPAIHIAKLPALGPVDAFARVTLLDDSGGRGRGGTVDSVAVPLVMAPDPSPWHRITATLVQPTDLHVLRQLVYRLGPVTLKQTRVAFTNVGAFLWREQGIETIPAGEFFRQVHRNIWVSAGYTPSPAVSAEVLHRALGEPTREAVFINRHGASVAVRLDAFVPLEQALLEAQSWTGTTAETVAGTPDIGLPELHLTSPGFRPMRDVSEASDQAEES